ncbi:TPA: hypothetical protein QDB15_000051 [Burkholderia vietnamiensis]|uniref:Transmembrane protein n=1 Tax=Pandoraea apista TaxID=93218 RepID=A0A5E5P228_9BURK|nr:MULTISPECIES: hypothetical protein [Burkholderiaceae]MCA8206325.1 hypothetical protein [Burkholderia vietnamiensis]VVG70404.1 hypothetical protein PAP18089_01364 [Pandoraea apista]HDR8943123.1 hypothetical protein [Burkholderia vietnamiensis]HDR9116327.1 hypothetical protein [Burkholderia vietnamiensis]HDR9205373.1 hypothetical protein [Burkholderia vietnamiensis]
MKPRHIRRLGALAIVALSLAGLPPLVHLWSAAAQARIAVADLVACVLYVVGTAPFNRWMLNDDGSRLGRASSYGHTIAWAVGLTVIWVANALFIPKGLHGLASVGVAVLLAVIASVVMLKVKQWATAWTYLRIDAAIERARG